jgi:hypothetical protein
LAHSLDEITQYVGAIPQDSPASGGAGLNRL